MESAQEMLTREFKKRKSQNGNFSLRAFARWLGLSPAQLSQMMSGKRSITIATLSKISERLGHSPTQRNLLLKSHLNHPLKEAQILGREPKRAPLDEDTFRLISDWYHFAILSLTRLKGSKGDPRWIASQLKISIHEAHQALLRLERLSLISTKPDFRQIGDPLSVASATPSPAIRNYHKQLLSLTSEKIDTEPNSRREIQSITFAMDPSLIGDLKAMIDEFLDQASNISESSTPKQVYALNVQLIPLSKGDTK